MKNKLYILIAISFLLLTGCSKLKSDEEWNKIKNKSDFSLFFQYAISSDNSNKLESCIDSLKKYKPQKPCKVLCYYNYYLPYDDSTYYQNFYIEDHCDTHYDYYYRDMLVVEIDANDSVNTLYLGEDVENYITSILKLHGSKDTSYNLPHYDYVEYNNQKYMQRRVGLFVYNKMFPDSLKTKTSWHKLIQVTKNIIATIDEVKDIKSKNIFGKNYVKLEHKKKQLINDLVPVFINIYFYLEEPPKIPPPPPPTTEEVLKILNEDE